MIALLDGVLTDTLLHEVAGRELRGPLSLLHAGNTASGRDKRLLFIAEQGSSPFALVKWARGTWADGLVGEQAAIRQVRASRDRLLAASCPPAWGPLRVGSDTLVTVQRYYPSRSVYSQLRNNLTPWRHAPTHFRAVSAWLTRFGQATLQPPRPFDDTMLDQYIAGPLRDFHALFGEAIAPAAFLDDLLRTARAHLGLTMPITAEHGDLWPSNVLLGRDPNRDLYIVDWEHYWPTSLGGFDIIFFCMTYTLEMPWRPLGWMTAPVALRRSFVERTWIARHIQHLLDDNCAAIDLPRSLLPVLLPVMVARLALRHADAAPGLLTGNLWPATFRAWADLAPRSWLVSWSQE